MTNSDLRLIEIPDGIRIEADGKNPVTVRLEEACVSVSYEISHLTVNSSSMSSRKS